MLILNHNNNIMHDAHSDSTELCSDEILFDYIHPDKIDIGEAHEFAVAIADGK